MTAASDGSGVLWRRQAQLWVLMTGMQLFDRQTLGHALCASPFCVFSQPFFAGLSDSHLSNGRLAQREGESEGDLIGMGDPCVC